MFSIQSFTPDSPHSLIPAGPHLSITAVLSLTPPSVGVLFPGGEFDPSIKEMLWITLLSSLLGKHRGHAEVTPGMTSSSMGDISEEAGRSLSAGLSRSNSTVPPALGEENTPC